jgi:cytochrome c peroxidase
VRTRSLIACFALALTGAGAYVYGHFTMVGPHDAEKTRTLGQKLFGDVRLSGDGKTSCATCHAPGRSFSDGKRVAIGLDGKTGTRNTPSLTAMIASGRQSFFWDGRRDLLDDAVMDPFSNPVEMGLHSRSEIAAKVGSLEDYRPWFPDGHSVTSDDIDRRIAAALATYLHSLAPTPTRFERFVRGDANAIDVREKLGMSLFNGKGQCSTCHQLAGARLTDNAFHRSGVSMDDIALRLPELTQGVLDRGLAGSALGDRVATHANEAQLGHFNVSHKATDLETFATPSLREVRLTGPYMHDGSVETLEAAVDREVYYRGLDTGYPIGLTAQERGDLRAFLETL